MLLALDKLWTDRRKPTPLGAEASEVAAAAAVADDVCVFVTLPRDHNEYNERSSSAGRE